MDRDRLRPLAVALLAVLALAVAAATLDSAVVSEAGSGLGAGGEGTGVGSGDAGPAGDDSDVAALGDSEGGFVLSYCWPPARQPPFLAALSLFFLGVFALTYRSTRSAFAGAAVCFAVGQPIFLVWFFLAVCREPSLPSITPEGTQNENASILPDGGGSGSLGDGTVETFTSPSVLLAVLVALAVAGLLVAILFGRRGEAADEDDEPAESPDDDRSLRVARAAGTAADRIEADADAGNEVYRAWRRMTDALEVDSPETTTPAEFADVAVEAGMDREDVADLTDLFETVRYGGAEPTVERERRAVETLRRIEDAYGD